MMTDADRDTLAEITRLMTGHWRYAAHAMWVDAIQLHSIARGTSSLDAAERAEKIARLPSILKLAQSLSERAAAVDSPRWGELEAPQ